LSRAADRPGEGVSSNCTFIHFEAPIAMPLGVGPLPDERGWKTNWFSARRAGITQPRATPGVGVRKNISARRAGTVAALRAEHTQNSLYPLTSICALRLCPAGGIEYKLIGIGLGHLLRNIIYINDLNGYSSIDFCPRISGGGEGAFPRAQIPIRMTAIPPVPIGELVSVLPKFGAWPCRRIDQRD